jgi:hypothetical protein
LVLQRGCINMSHNAHAKGGPKHIAMHLGCQVIIYMIEMFGLEIISRNFKPFMQELRADVRC